MSTRQEAVPAESIVILELNCAGKILDLRHPVVMGVLNVTPDSFSDGGQYAQLDHALARAERMVEEGAAIIDVGGESSRPGAESVPLQEELRRVIPLIEQLAACLPVPISIDTYKPDVMRAAVGAGAGFINDIKALQEPAALEAAVALAVPVCLMHMQGEPATMQHDPKYDNVSNQVHEFLVRRRDACLAAGMPFEKIVLDPGFGFGKTVTQNYQLFAELPRMIELNSPLLVGVSRKSMIGAVVSRAVDGRKLGSVCLATLAAYMGARIIRAHDVRETVEALALVRALAEPNAIS